MKRFHWSYLAPLTLALALIAGLVFGNLPAAARNAGGAATAPKPPAARPDAGTIVVTPANLAGWRWMEEDTAAGGGMLVTGPAVPPLGTGSARLSVDSTGRFILSNLTYAGTRLADITSLGYST